MDEIFRFTCPIERLRAARRGGLTWYASVDIEVGGVTIRAGDTVMFAVQEANEDERVGARPAYPELGEHVRPLLRGATQSRHRYQFAGGAQRHEAAAVWSIAAPAS